ncbi:MAG TPA: HD domain-containing phosphohydrolase [Planctomycetaceae bacterium]
MSERILFVDDDANVLQGLQRQLRKKFDFDTSTSPEAALESLGTSGPYAVVVSDMQMPGTNGVQFLEKVRVRAPHTVRIMLTGNADQQTAMDAVNRGAIFRFVNKPCPSEVLCEILTAAISQFRLVTAEKDILEKTLSGSVRLLTEILGLVNPIIFSRSSRIRQVARELAVQLGLDNTWQLEVAAMLSQIGCITLTPQTLEAIYSGKALSPDDADRYAAHPEIAGKLLAHIPRFEFVSRIVASQDAPFDPIGCSNMPKDRDPTIAAGQVLKVAIHFDRLVASGLAPLVAAAGLRKRPTEFDPIIVRELAQMQSPETEPDVRTVQICELNVGAILAEDLRSNSGALLLTKGQTVTYALMVRLRNFWAKREIPERLRVRIPAAAVQSA